MAHQTARMAPTTKIFIPWFLSTRHMQRKFLTQIRWLCVCLITLGHNLAYGAITDEMALIEAGDLFVTPKILIGKQVGVRGGGVLCLDQNHCVVENPLSPILFMKLDTKAMKPEDRSRLAKECHQLLCSEFLVGNLTPDGFQATRSYASQHLLSPQVQDSSSSLIRDLSERRGNFTVARRLMF